MKEEQKQKLAYWIENMLYLGGIAFGASIVIGGLYMLYVVISALIGQCEQRRAPTKNISLRGWHYIHTKLR